MSYNIGVIGIGIHGCHSLEQVMVQAGNAKIKKICSQAEFGVGVYPEDLPAQSKAYAEQFQSELVADWREVVADPEIDIISLMTCPKVKAEIIIEAFRNGKHVVTDKPLAFTVEQAEAVCQAEKESKGRGFMLAGYHTRPLIVKLIEAIGAGKLGELKSISLRLCFMGGVFPTFKPSPKWRSENVAGELSTIGSHALITLMKLANAEITSIYAVTKNNFYDSYKAAGAEDCASLNVLFDSGLVANAFVARLPHRVPNEDIVLEITGTNGYAEISGDKLNIYPGQESYQIPVDGGAVLLETFKHFFECIESGDEMLTSFSDGLKLQQALTDSMVFSQNLMTMQKEVLLKRT